MVSLSTLNRLIPQIGSGHSGHILTTIPAGQHIQSYEMIDGDNTQQGDMVMVLQQQLIQMLRSEAYRLGYIQLSLTSMIIVC